VTIGAEESDPIAALYARLPQGTRKPPGALGEFRIGKTILIADRRDSARILLLRVAKEAQWG
jgi:hypothetical protein